MPHAEAPQAHNSDCAALAPNASYRPRSHFESRRLFPARIYSMNRVAPSENRREIAMQLSLEDYQSLLQSIRPLGARRPSDKRKHFRIDTDARVTIVPLELGQRPRPFSIAVTDVSRMGVRLARDVPLKIGQQFILCLTMDDPARTRPVVCIVRRVDPHPRLGFVMGCEFTDSGRTPVRTDAIVDGLENFQAELFEADAVELGLEPRRRRGGVMKKLAGLFGSR
jgi:PilZ domain